MADKKISELVVASNVLAADLIPIVSGGLNKSISAGILALNLPNLGNKGITKNNVVAAISNVIPLTVSLITLPPSGAPYTLGVGSDGQELTIVSSGANTVSPIAAAFATILMSSSSSVTLIYINSMSKWIVKSFYDCTFA